MAAAKKSTPVIKTKDGEDVIPEAGMLVRFSKGCCHNTLARLVSVNIAARARDHSLQVIPIHSRDQHTVYLQDTVLVSRTPLAVVEGNKEPPLVERIENFHRNLYKLLQKLSNSRSLKTNSADYALINKLFRTLTLFDVATEYRWFWSTISESLDDPRKIAYATSEESVDLDSRRRKCGITRFLKGKAKLHGLNFEAAEADRIGYLIGVHFPSCYNYTFEILRGESIYFAYKESPEAWNSCMKGRRYVRWYSANPDSVALVKVCLGNIYEGRALLWTTEQGTKILDRVYPSDNGPQTLALHRLCEDNGWDYKTRQGSDDCSLNSGIQDHKVKMSLAKCSQWNKSVGFPYLDTFKYTDNNPGSSEEVVLTLTPGAWRFTCTGGGYDRYSRRNSPEETVEEINCFECNEELDSESVSRGPDDEVYCDSCFGERFIEVDYQLDSGEWISGTYYYGDIRACRSCGTCVLPEHSTTVDGRDYCWLHPPVPVVPVVPENTDQPAATLGLIDIQNLLNSTSVTGGGIWEYTSVMSNLTVGEPS